MSQACMGPEREFRDDTVLVLQNPRRPEMLLLRIYSLTTTSTKKSRGDDFAPVPTAK
jgi:hypothetical protein